MRKNLWIVTLCCIVIIGGGLYFLRQQSTSSNQPDISSEPPGKGVIGNAKLDADPFDVVITYTDDGYSPSDITISKGQRVRFLNASKATTWPASSIHPTHTIYPEKESTDCLGSSFDACQPLQNGEFFDFTFYYPGTWRFHDHVHPYDTGSITVTASSSLQ